MAPRFIWLLLLLVAPFKAQEYAGSRACAACHKEIAASWAESAMGRSITEVSPALLDRILPRNVGAESKRWQRLYEVKRQGATAVQSMSQRGPDGKLLYSLSYPMRYVIGSGANGYTFLIERDGFLYEAPLSYYARPGKWDLSPGYENADAGFNRRAGPECLGCHAGRLETGLANGGRFSAKPFAEVAIACETCHGPGAGHVEGNPKAIVNPAKLDARLGEDVCQRCHQDGHARVLLPGKSWNDFRPGQPITATLALFAAPGKTGDPDLLQHHAAMKESRCFEASEGKLSCLTCHGIHRAKSYREACRSCHKGAHRDDAQRSSSDCTSCHMPKRETATISHALMSNHRIPRKPSEQRTQAARPLQLGGLPPETRLRVLSQIAPHSADAASAFERLLTELSKGPTTDSFVALMRARRITASNAANDQLLSLFATAAKQPPDALLWTEWAEALTRAGKTAEARKVLETGLRAAPYERSIYKALAAAFLADGQTASAAATLRRYLKDFPEDASAREILEQIPQ